MPTPTYTPLANITLGSSAASVSFSSISQAYRDLVLVMDAKSASVRTATLTRFNGDTGSNYSHVSAEGDGSSTNSGSGTGTFLWLDKINLLTSTQSQLTTFSIMDYSATDKHKTALFRSNNSSLGTEMLAGRWASTSAVSTILLYGSGGVSFAAGSSFALYGIAA